MLRCEVAGFREVEGRRREATSHHQDGDDGLERARRSLRVSQRRLR